MIIKEIAVSDLRDMNNSEGLILQGCGGDVKEWVDGINGLLTEEGILKDNSRFENCSVFKNKGLTCLLFPFTDELRLDMGKLALWRIKTHGSFGGTWLSDYVPSYLGGFNGTEQPIEDNLDSPDDENGMEME